MPPTVRSRSRPGDFEPTQPKPRSDVYTGLLLIALLAQIVGTVFLYLDYSSYDPPKPPKVQASPPAFQPPPAGQAGAQGGQ
jgi:hypothetical protein